MHCKSACARQREAFILQVLKIHRLLLCAAAEALLGGERSW
jgi:hypothetical protein